MNIGILALQGAVEPHKEKLKQLSINPVEVRTPSDLASLEGIILPGGESTTFLHLLRLNSLWEPLRDFCEQKPTWGICAGAILLASKVTCPSQTSLGLLDVTIERNAYGRQAHSFIAPILPTSSWSRTDSFEGVFIRAPKISFVSPGVETLFSFNEAPVMVRKGHLLASTFHPELTASAAIHEYFVKMREMN